MLVTKTDRTVCVCPSAGSNGRRLLQATLRCEAQREKASAVSTRARRAVTGHTSVVPLLSPCGLPDGYVSLTRRGGRAASFPLHHFSIVCSLACSRQAKPPQLPTSTLRGSVTLERKRSQLSSTRSQGHRRLRFSFCARAHPVYTVQFVA